MSNPRIEIISDFPKYCRYILPSSFRWLWFHETIANAINAAINGTGPRRCMFFMGPRHGKTTLAADCFLTYMFGRFPEKIGAYTTYNEKFAQKRKNMVEVILNSPNYKSLFPNAKTRSGIEDLEDLDYSIRKTKKNTALQISNVGSTGGNLIFAGRGTGITGEGLHYAALDDPYKDDEETDSDVIKGNVEKWFDKVFLTRQEPGQIVLIFYTRWVSDDIAGMVIERNEQNVDPDYEPWGIYRFASERDESNEFNEDSYDHRKLGEQLDPARKGAYADAKKNPETWMAMHQQTPLDKKGRLFDISRFGYYHYYPRLCQLVISVDANFKEKSATVDRTGIGIWAKVMNKYYLIEFVNRKMNYPELKAVVKAYTLKYPNYWALLIEVASNGGPLYQELVNKIPRVIGIEPKSKSKRERAQLMLPVHDAGQIMLPAAHLCPNIAEFVLEFSRFTGLKEGEKDDLVDQTVQAINYYEKYSAYAGHSLVDSIPNENSIYYQQKIAYVPQSIILVE